jgi:hypothetical protein
MASGLHAWAAEPASRPASVGRVPIIYSTDLLHPHDDPDDHFDLATLFAIPEFDIRAIVLDLGERQQGRPGRVPVEQMLALTGCRVPYASGLSAALKSPEDTGRGQPAADQAGVDLLLRVLRESPEPVVVITAGSLRDVCAAFNREPELLRKKISRLYINIGNGATGTEWNVTLDSLAYVRIMRSGLPIYWCPCQPFRDPRSTFWEFGHAEVLESAPTGLQNFFIYALQTVPPELIDPVAALQMDLRPWRGLVWKMRRQMWCTASFLHAADLRPVATGGGEYVIKPLSQVPAGQKEVFSFVPARIDIDDSAQTKLVPDAPANMHVFQGAEFEQYNRAMTRCLVHLLQHFPATAPAGR